MKIIFDMDGTIADLYGVENWLSMLRAEDTSPYTNAKPLVNMSRLAKAIHKAQRLGVIIAIVSWGALASSNEYLEQTATAKREWLTKHLPSVIFDEIIIAPYGENKSNYADKNSILFDDNEKIRNDFIGTAYEPYKIFDILKTITE